MSSTTKVVTRDIHRRQQAMQHMMLSKVTFSNILSSSFSHRRGEWGLVRGANTNFDDFFMNESIRSRSSLLVNPYQAGDACIQQFGHKRLRYIRFEPSGCQVPCARSILRLGIRIWKKWNKKYEERISSTWLYNVQYRLSIYGLILWDFSQDLGFFASIWDLGLFCSKFGDFIPFGIWPYRVLVS